MLRQQLLATLVAFAFICYVFVAVFSGEGVTTLLRASEPANRILASTKSARLGVCGGACVDVSACIAIKGFCKGIVISKFARDDLILVELSPHAYAALHRLDAPGVSPNVYTQRYVDIIEHIPANARKRIQHRVPRLQTAAPTLNLCIATIVRNEAAALNDWADWHRVMGADFFIILDNYGNDGIRDTARQDTAVITWNSTKTQGEAYVFVQLVFQHVCRWFAFMDMDQYFYSETHSLTSVIVKYGEEQEASLIQIPSRAFASTGTLDRDPSVSIVELCLYTECPKGVIQQNPTSIVRSEALAFDTEIHTSGILKYAKRVTLQPFVAVWNHYTYRSWRDYYSKYTYGRVGTVPDWDVSRLAPEADADTPVAHWNHSKRCNLDTRLRDMKRSIGCPRVSSLRQM